MPHIVFEATRCVARTLDFNKLTTEVHLQLAELGYASIDDLKSRLYVSNVSLAGADPRAEFLAARLTIMNTRSLEVQQAMGRVIHEVMRRAIENQSPDYWWQCSVFIETFEPAHYLKTDSRMVTPRK